MYPAFTSELEEESGLSVDYRTDGGLFVPVPGTDKESRGPDNGPDQSRASRQFDQEFGLERLTGSDLTRFEPALTREATSAIFIPGDHQVDNRRLMPALGTAVRRAGVEVRESSEVSSIAINAGRVAGVTCGIERFEAPEVIIAAGCWSSALLKPAGLDLDVVPVRCQMLAVRGPALHHAIHSEDCYLVPRSDGRVLIGATVEYAGFRKAVTIDGITRLIDAAVRLVPVIALAEILETWCGLRPDSPDHLPVMGPTGIDGLTLATGHFRNGILLAPVTSQLIAEAIVGRHMSPELTTFGVGRLLANSR
jgi:glycine oxidase